MSSCSAIVVVAAVVIIVFNIHMSGLMKTVLISTQPPWHFSKKIHRLFHSIIHKQSVNTEHTDPSCMSLAGWLQTAKAAGHCWPRLSCKENEQFKWRKCLSLWPNPTPLGLEPGGPAGSQAPGPSSPTLLDGSSPGFSSTAKASLPTIAGRQARKFCSKFDAVFINSDIHVYVEFPLHCTSPYLFCTHSK